MDNLITESKMDRANTTFENWAEKGYAQSPLGVAIRDKLKYDGAVDLLLLLTGKDYRKENPKNVGSHVGWVFKELDRVLRKLVEESPR